MPARGAFSNKCKTFLESKQAKFAAAVENNHIGDTLAIIFRQYFKRFPVDLDDDKEPSEEALAAVDDSAADPEIEEPSESLSPGEYAAAVEAAKVRQLRIQAKRGQITRWFSYRYAKDHDIDPRSTDPKNPYNALLLQLTGNLLSGKPRRKAPVNVWVRDKSSTQVIKAEVERLLNGRQEDPRKMVAIRSEAARLAFQKLPDTEQEKWKVAADEEYHRMTAEYEQLCKGAVSTKPEDRQRAINGLVRFSQPILDCIALVTGFKVSLFAGGPEPARQGRLSVISMHSGTTPGDIPLNFGQAERVAYKQYIMPIWGRFMRACFTPEECRRRALPAGSTDDTLQSTTTDNDGMSFHSFGIPEAIPANGPFHHSQSVLANEPDSVHSHPSTPVNPPVSAQSPQTGIVSITEAIRSMSRRIEESVARSIAGSISPAASLVPSPLPSVASSPAATTSKRPRTLSVADPTSKRPRALAHAAPYPRLPADAPLWVCNAFKMFLSKDFEGNWQELVAAWVVYEERRNFEGKKLSPKGRPKIVAEWIKWARKPTWRPSSLPKANDFDREHTSWWQSLQPAWRVTGDGGLSRQGEGDWESLHVGGANGLLSALASLYFWALAIRHAGGSTDSWNTIVNDTLFVIQQLTADLK